MNEYLEEYGTRLARLRSILDACRRFSRDDLFVWYVWSVPKQAFYLRFCPDEEIDYPDVEPGEIASLACFDTQASMDELMEEDSVYMHRLWVEVAESTYHGDWPIA